MTELRRIVVCGVGLIGGSFGLAQKSAGIAEVIGIGRSRASLEAAVARGAIDRSSDDWADAANGADLVLLATPVGQMEEVMRQLAPHLSPGTLVTDGGSTKQDVIAAAVAALDDHVFLAESFDNNRRGMEQLVAGFKRLGLEHIPAHGNFITFRLGDAAAVNQKLLRQGVIVRPLGNYAMPEHLRVTIGTETENARFLEALAKSL